MAISGLFRSAALIGVLAVGGIVSPAAAQDKVRLMLNWKADGSNAVYYLAEEKGFFKAEGIDIQIDVGEGGGAPIPRIASGTYEAGFGDINSMTQYDSLHPENSEIAVLCFYDKSPMAVITLTKNNITKPTDLIGKKVGAPQNDTGYQMFPAFAKATGIDMKQINFENVAPNIREPLLVKGDVAAVTGYDSTAYFGLKGLGLKRADVVFLYYQDYGVKLYSNAILVSKAYAERSPKAVQGLVRAVIKGYQVAIKDPGAAIDAVVRYESLLKRDIELEKWNWLIENQIATPAAKAAGFGTVDPARLEQGIDIVTAAFNLQRRPAASEIYTDRFLPPLAERQFP